MNHYLYGNSTNLYYFDLAISVIFKAIIFCKVFVSANAPHNSYNLSIKASRGYEFLTTSSKFSNISSLYLMVTIILVWLLLSLTLLLLWLYYVYIFYILHPCFEGKKHLVTHLAVWAVWLQQQLLALKGCDYLASSIMDSEQARPSLYKRFALSFFHLFIFVIERF